MTVIDDYLQTLDVPTRDVVARMYTIARQLAPDATEELSYNMPAFKYKGKGLVAIMANKNFLSLYPFGLVERLGVDVSAYETTSGSIHFDLDHPIPDDLLREIITARMAQIDK
jgi:uncharacterized protein YdhG (YjbR/CyaY superfamily)